MNVSVSEPQDIAYDPEIYSSFPDILRLPDGQLWCIYREGDTHHPKESRIIIMSSQDNGAHWDKSIFQQANLEDDGFVFNCPRLNFVNNKIAIVTDIKTAQNEGQAKFSIHAWWSNNYGVNWSDRQDMKIEGMVPDKIIPMADRLLMGYHFGEKTKMIVTGAGFNNRLVQMMAESSDGGETWRDRTTIAASDKHSFCEGSIVNVGSNRLLCYVRDNRSAILKSQIVSSVDGGRVWSRPVKMNLQAHRIVASVKHREPYKGAVIATFRDTVHKSIGLLIHNITSGNMQKITLDKETYDALFDFGYTGWVELEDGTLIVVYYIRRDNPNPRICLVKVQLK
jgi:hypothetical protein